MQHRVRPHRATGARHRPCRRRHARRLLSRRSRQRPSPCGARVNSIDAHPASRENTRT